jgi:hypothetical protein
MFNQDYKEMLLCLKEEQAEFIIVGAYAMAAHGFPRSTADFDIWVNPTKENSFKVFHALARFGAPMKDISEETFTEKGILYQIGVAPCRIDIITEISGNISFSAAALHAERIDFGKVTVPVLSVKNLIANKLATGRPKDLEDADQLQKRLQ